MNSLRSRLIFASVLSTGGLLALMHLFAMLVIHIFPRFQGFPQLSIVMPLAAIAMAIGVQTVRRSLSPFALLHEKLQAVRLGAERRVEGRYPSEVQPLVDDLNSLLNDKEKAVQRAFATAGDLAHGLKTHLALLARESDRLRVSGDPDMAESIAQQVEGMLRHVNYQLVRARAAASGLTGAGPCCVADCADALIRTLRTLYARENLAISAEVPIGLMARVQLEDLEEILGNVLDNACKWARSKVLLTATQQGELIILTVDDDGPGLAIHLRTLVLARGVRLDETTGGTGLGLAIVRDLIELYQGSLTLEDSPFGGLRARISLSASATVRAAGHQT